MKSAIIALIGLALLSACAPTLSNVDPNIDRLTAPNVVAYTAAQQDEAAKELDSYCDNIPIVCDMMDDYGVMRDQSRLEGGETVDVNR